MRCYALLLFVLNLAFTCDGDIMSRKKDTSIEDLILPDFEEEKDRQLEDFTRNEKELTNDPKRLIGEIKLLRQRTVEYYWLLGQRLQKLKKLYMEGRCYELVGEDIKHWVDFCKFYLKMSQKHTDALIKVYENIEWEELPHFNFSPSKTAIIASIGDKQARLELAKRVNDDKLSRRETDRIVSTYKREARKLKHPNSNRSRLISNNTVSKESNGEITSKRSNVSEASENTNDQKSEKNTVEYIPYIQDATIFCNSFLNSLKTGKNVKEQINRLQEFLQQLNNIY